MSKFNSTELSSSSTAAGSGSSKATRTADTVYTGGIFSRLEVQFRAQQAAKALAHQTRQAVFENNFKSFTCIFINFTDLKGRAARDEIRH